MDQRNTVWAIFQIIKLWAKSKVRKKDEGTTEENTWINQYGLYLQLPPLLANPDRLLSRDEGDTDICHYLELDTNWENLDLLSPLDATFRYSLEDKFKSKYLIGCMEG